MIFPISFPRRRTSWLVAGCLATSFVTLGICATSLAGLGPTNLLLVVNANDPTSKAIANEYIALRRLSPNNVLYLDWKFGDRQINIDQFRHELLSPIRKFLARRKLTDQIDCIVYSSGFPWGIDFSADVPPILRKAREFEYQFKFPTASLTGATFLHEQVVTKDATKYAAYNANRYMRLRESTADGDFQLPADRKGQLIQTVGHQRFTAGRIDPSSIGSHGFHHQYRWGINGELLRGAGSQYLLSIMLGVTNGTGNNLREILGYLRANAPADGTFPTGTIYFMKERSKDNGIRSIVREPGYAMAIQQLQSLGIAARILDRGIPNRRRDVQGLLTGIDQFDWRRSGSTILPGAICENLTSYSAIFDPGTGQTPCSEFLRYGAAGTAGTVNEPYSIQNKFPHAMIQVHYARGCSLAEAFYQSIYMPYQTLILGDPLCRPWANVPQVKVEGVADGATLKGTVAIQPSAQLPRGGQCSPFELYADGQRLTVCPAGGQLEIDTAKYADGAHELRIVGIEQGPIETQGETIVDVRFDNFGRTMEFTADSPIAGAPIKGAAKCVGADGLAIYHNGQTVAKITGESGEATIDLQRLGDGPVTLAAFAWHHGEAICIATPIKLQIRSAR
ncbi:MAG: hypothetical protein IT427_02525 [Pirellulales bacterium]|nr:hypothetical protein [Pirellulales bacterium]